MLFGLGSSLWIATSKTAARRAAAVLKHTIGCLASVRINPEAPVFAQLFLARSSTCIASYKSSEFSILNIVTKKIKLNAKLDFSPLQELPQIRIACYQTESILKERHC